MRARARLLVTGAVLAGSTALVAACILGDVPQDGKPCQFPSDCVPDYVCDTFLEAGVCHRRDCDPGLTYCGGDECTDLQSDPANCGRCGSDCLVDPLFVNDSTERCNAGKCATFCFAGKAVRDGGRCSLSPAQCGSFTCPAGFTCQPRPDSGVSRCGCKSGADCGPGGTCAPSGTCSCHPGGPVCRSGELCDDQGQCQCGGPCGDAGPESVCCGGAGCKDLMTDVDNCGLCGLQCPPSLHFVCDNGSCHCTQDSDCAVGLGVDAGVHCDVGSGLCVCPTAAGPRGCQSAQRCTIAGCR